MRQEFPKSVKRDSFLRAMGRCEECGVKLRFGEVEYDHELEDFLGGEPTLSNCRCLCARCHRAKTKARRKEIDKTRRIEEKRMGLRQSSHSLRHPTLRKRMDGRVQNRITGEIV